MKLTVRQKEDFHFVGKGESGIEVPIDAAGYVGGKGRGVRPPELLFLSIAGCMGIHVYEALHKAGKHVEDIVVNTDSERKDTYPKVFTKIYLDFTIKGKDLSEQDVKEAIETALNKTCSIAYMINQVAPISYTFKIEKG
ncbi:MAG: OsmC family protein [Hydrogenobaculum sp.]|jgi:putative redox protein|uniref:OsmC family protein n=1 Tax=Hydrogenobaculum sp. (strain Y04AAS1) TaxID=380749 RepID=UPI00015BD3EB|nr:OsmC family protein [Hydrogenobaculum sp. Y04AAS1]HCT66959.1 OsmC family peroxiredoxin [Hydrogenobaculum sp.]